MRRLAGDAQQTRLFGSEIGLMQHVDHADHGVHRRADPVAHGGDESRLGAARFLGAVSRLFEVGHDAHALADVAHDRRPQTLARNAVGAEPDVEGDAVAVAVLAEGFTTEARDHDPGVGRSSIFMADCQVAEPGNQQRDVATHHIGGRMP